MYMYMCIHIYIYICLVLSLIAVVEVVLLRYHSSWNTGLPDRLSPADARRPPGVSRRRENMVGVNMVLA